MKAWEAAVGKKLRDEIEQKNRQLVDKTKCEVERARFSGLLEAAERVRTLELQNADLVKNEIAQVRAEVLTLMSNNQASSAKYEGQLQKYEVDSRISSKDLAEVRNQLSDKQVSLAKCEGRMEGQLQKYEVDSRISSKDLAEVRNQLSDKQVSLAKCEGRMENDVFHRYFSLLGVVCLFGSTLWRHFYDTKKSDGGGVGAAPANVPVQPGTLGEYVQKLENDLEQLCGVSMKKLAPAWE